MTSLLLLLIGGISHVFLMFLVIKLVLHLDLGNCKRKDLFFIFYRIAISCLIMMESHEVKKKYNENYIKISHIYNFSLWKD